MASPQGGAYVRNRSLAAIRANSYAMTGIDRMRTFVGGGNLWHQGEAQHVRTDISVSYWRRIKTVIRRFLGDGRVGGGLCDLRFWQLWDERTVALGTGGVGRCLAGDLELVFCSRSSTIFRLCYRPLS